MELGAPRPAAPGVAEMAALGAAPNEQGAPRHITRWSNTGFEKYAARG